MKDTMEQIARAHGAEMLTGLGEFRAGHGAIVTEWCKTADEAWRSYCELAGLPVAGSVDNLVIRE